MSFSDIRVAGRADWLIERVATAGAPWCCASWEDAHKQEGCRSIFAVALRPGRLDGRNAAARTAPQCAGRRILRCRTPPTINFAGRDKKRRGLAVGIATSHLGQRPCASAGTGSPPHSKDMLLLHNAKKPGNPIVTGVSWSSARGRRRSRRVGESGTKWIGK